MTRVPGRGTYPADLPQASQPAPIEAARQYRGVGYSPELHLLDSEWFFTPRTSKALAAMLGDTASCLLGSPTVASELPAGSYTLVDLSPFVLRRFPRIAPADLVTTAIDRSTRLPRCSSVLLDPPWYWPSIADWLSVALDSLDGRGRLLLPLLGEGTRPTAEADRRAILDLLSAAGRVELLPDFVEYDVPLFESRALAAAGVELTGPWRYADLAVVHVERASVVPAIVRPAVPVVRWSTFVIGEQVVKLRADARGGAGDGRALGQVPGVEDLVLDSVSQRDPRRSAIDLWTSRNRVGQVYDRALVADSLATLEGSSEGLPERVHKLAVEQTADSALLLRLLELVDD